jgi:flagellar FliL protein
LAEQIKTGAASSAGRRYAALAIVALLGGGSGFGLTTAQAILKPALSPAGEVAAAPIDPTRADEAGRPAGSGLKEHILPLEPLIVNIGGSAGRWLRLEASVASAQPFKDDREAVIAQLGEDLAGLLRSTSLAQIESPVGLEFLRDDMSDLVRLRTKGRATRLILRSLVVE